MEGVTLRIQQNSREARGGPWVFDRSTHPGDLVSDAKLVLRVRAVPDRDDELSILGVYRAV